MSQQLNRRAIHESRTVRRLRAMLRERDRIIEALRAQVTTNPRQRAGIGD